MALRWLVLYPQRWLLPLTGRVWGSVLAAGQFYGPGQRLPSKPQLPLCKVVLGWNTLHVVPGSSSGMSQGERTGEALRGGCQGGHLPALPLQGPGEAVPPWVSSLQSHGLVDPFCESRLELVSCPRPAGGHLRDGESPSTGLVGKEAIVHSASTEVALPPL